MSVTLTLTFDRPRVPEDHPLHARAAAGFTSLGALERLHPATIRVVERSSSEKPSIRELVDTADRYHLPGWPPRWSTAHFVGFLNSDILLGEAFARKMPRWVDYDAIRVRRTDLGPDLGPEGRPLRTPSAEGIIVRSKVWRQHGATFPEEFVIGEPFWDPCWILWLVRRGLRVGRLDHGEVCHPVHPETWRKNMNQYRNTRLFYRWLRHNGYRAWPDWDRIDGKEDVL